MSDEAEKKPDGSEDANRGGDIAGKRGDLSIPTTGSSLIVLREARRNPLLSWLRQNGSTAMVAGVAGAFAGGLVAVALGLAESGTGSGGPVMAGAGGVPGLNPDISYETTGSISADSGDRAVGWTLWRVRDGRALVQGESGYFEVAPGSRLPGLGLVQRIEREDGDWVVETSSGRILPESG